MNRSKSVCTEVRYSRLNLESFYYVSEHRQTHEDVFMIHLRIETCLTSLSRTYKTITLHMITHKTISFLYERKPHVFYCIRQPEGRPPNVSLISS